MTRMRRSLVQDHRVRAFAITGSPRGFMPGSRPAIRPVEDNSAAQRITFSNHLYNIRGGFKVIKFEYATGPGGYINKLAAVIEIFHMPPSFLLVDVTATKLGTVSLIAVLKSPGSRFSDPEWTISLVSTCLYNQGNADQLPAEVRDIGPGAYMTGVTQALLGTKQGLKMLGLSEDQIPTGESR